MTAFLKIDKCQRCQRALPWEFVPTVLANGKPLAGTGVWRSPLSDGVCSPCATVAEAERIRARNEIAFQSRLLQLLGGPKPVREFTFDRFKIESGNRLGYECSRDFSPAINNLYLWGSCGVGKTHLAWAIARRCYEESLSVTILAAYQLSRKIRMKEPALEQEAIDRLACVDVLVLDDLGTGADTPFSRQILQEILDARSFTDHAGLVVTSRYSLDDLAARLGDDTIPSRLAGLCRVVRIRGGDGRIAGDRPE